MGNDNDGKNNREITIDEVSQHNSVKSMWIIFEDKVLDITNFLQEHPGGDEILHEVAGQDGTSRFRDVNHSKDAYKMTEQFVIGSVKKPSAVSDSSSSCKRCYCLYIMAATAVVGVGLVVAYKCSRK